MKHIATRPRAARLGSHGIFGDEESVDLDAAMDELEHYEGNVWTHIISLKREDAERLGYDNAKAWRNLLRAHRNEIAAAMHIPPKDFRWYAAFHNEGHHPYVHMMAWSVKPGQAYLTRDGICRSGRGSLTTSSSTRCFSSTNRSPPPATRWCVKHGARSWSWRAECNTRWQTAQR